MTGQTGDQNDLSALIRDGAHRVRRRLIAPLVDDGMASPARLGKGEAGKARLEAALARLAERLAHLGEDELDGLRVRVERMAAEEAGRRGGRRMVWPDFTMIARAGEALRPPPGPMDRMLVSYMRSAAGREAAARGEAHLVALYRVLRAERYLVPDTDRFRARCDEVAEEIVDGARRNGGLPPGFLADLADARALLRGAVA